MAMLGLAERLKKCLSPHFSLTVAGEAYRIGGGSFG
jgi:hypothetical protein